MASGRLPLPTSVDDGVGPVVKRRKRNSERLRVTRACDRCKRRKVKCNGRQPCEFCSRAKTSCTFDSAYARGRVPLIEPASDVEVGNTPPPADDIMTPSTKSPSVSGQPYLAMPGTEDSRRHEAGLRSDDVSSRSLTRSGSAFVASSAQNSPEPSQTDLQGHYVGPASGVSFLLRVQKRLHQSISFSNSSSIFTFGDAPLHSPETDPSLCVMLPKDHAQRLVDRYFDFAMPTYRFLHRPTMQGWLDEFYDTFGAMRDAHAAPAKIALLFMVFAHGRVYMPDDDRPGPSDLSARYYLAAEHQLSKERDSIRLTSVQARLTQCFYLLTQSRINHSWSLFGTVSRLALAIGLNRSRRSDPASGVNQIEAECRRRTFWCAYTLDTYLSVALGRPRTFHDEDIDTELPTCVDDHMITAGHVSTPASNEGLSTMLGPLAHMKIARIIGKITRQLYSIRPISARRRAVYTKRISKELQDWRLELSRFLDADAFSTSLLIPIYQRQRNVLNLTYYHAVILVHRPFVLRHFAQSSQREPRIIGQDLETADSMQQCMTAAMKTVSTIDDMTQNHQLGRSFWITAYFAFTAIIMLYIYVIQNSASPPEVYNEYLLAANRCQSHLSAMAEKGSLSERYCMVLDELRVEALRQAKRMHPSAPAALQWGAGAVDGDQPSQAQASNFQTAPDVTLDDSPSTATNYTDLIGRGAIDFIGMPDTLLSDYSGWGQFASMVSSGFGNLDTFLNDDSFRL